MLWQLLLWVIPLLFAGRREQFFQIIALRQQLDVYQRQQGGKRLRLNDANRRFWMMLRSQWPRWRDALVIVNPEVLVEGQ